MYDVQLGTHEEQRITLDENTLSRHDVATRLLELTKVQSLRKETRNNREWMGIYRGFRADSLTRPLFVRGAAAFARQPVRLRELCDVFLADLGVPKEGDLAGRFHRAAENAEADEATRSLCLQLANVDLEKLP